VSGSVSDIHSQEDSMKYMHKDSRSGYWLYKRQFPDKEWFSRSFLTTNRKKAEETWPVRYAEYNRIARAKLSKGRFEGSKDACRAKFWQAVAQFLIAQKAANGGRLPIPYSAPTAMRVLSHPFTFVRSNFLAWARDNDPDAVTVFELGDKVEEPLFHAGVVAAYYVVSEMERLGASSS
jgi:hypothetical protein